MSTLPETARGSVGAVPPLVLFETHSWSEDNEAGVATGWLPGTLSVRGLEAARALGERHRSLPPDVVYTSDLHRAVQTAELAFGGHGPPIVKDHRLRECDYGRLNGSPVHVVHGDRSQYLASPYPQGESWQMAVDRVAGFIEELRHTSASRVVVIGHVATRWAFQHAVDGVPLESLLDEEFDWQPGWEYDLGGLRAP
jgi:2,3-bisphosphoglycerate-dependent phosphoglycerate mutase